MDPGSKPRGVSSGKEASKGRRWPGDKLMGERGIHSVPSGPRIGNGRGVTGNQFPQVQPKNIVLTAAQKGKVQLWEDMSPWYPVPGRPCVILQRECEERLNVMVRSVCRISYVRHGE